MQYEDFIQSKRLKFEPVGFDTPDEINAKLFDWQADIVRWSLRRGRAAIFADCGLGKSFMQIEWAQHVHRYTDGNVLILAPLAVSQQTVREAAKLGYTVHLCKTGADVQHGLNIANYERLHHFDAEDFTGIVLDESSILKAYDGIVRRQITEFGADIPYRLACTATPAPNDLVELCNHSEFLGVMNENEVKALFFTQDGNSTQKWRLKGHAQNEFWHWMATWSVALRKPSDLGYSDDGFILPACRVNQVTVDLEDENFDNGMLFNDVLAVGLSEQRAARKASLDDRVAAAAELVNNSDAPWLVWCDLNAESEALTKAIPDAVQITGSDSPEYKEQSMMDFSDGKIRVLVTKPSIAGFGMNWQHCANVAFVGLSHSYEAYYQAIRRVWRFGQKNVVNAYIITSTADGAVVQNIERKEKQSMDMFDEIVGRMSIYTDVHGATRNEMEYKEDAAYGPDWTLYLGDSVHTMRHIPDESIGLSVFSPPFPGMYVYTNSPNDMGNVATLDQMIDQFRYLMDQDHLYRIMMPGRTVAIHITQLIARKNIDGYMGIKDYRGRIIAMMEDIGWIYYGDITIDKNPQLKAQRTKDHGLMFKSLISDSARMHMAMADYILQFRKPGENPAPIRAGTGLHGENPDGWITNYEWVNWARPVWYAADYMPGTWREGYNGDSCHDGIRETDVLNVVQARETNDERHLCPLQLPVIERCVKLWSAPGETVYSPFAGIGSEGYMSLKLNRKFIGCELKESYWKSAVANLKRAEQEKGAMTLFDLMAAD